MSDPQQPSKIGDRLAKAMQAAVSGNTRVFEHICREILNDRPEDPVICHQLGTLLFRQGLVQPAIQALQRAVDLAPGEARYRNDLGIAYTAGNELAAGEQCFLDVLKDQPDDAPARYNLALNYRKQSRIDEALSHCRKALAVNAGHAGAIMLLGDLLRLRKQPDEAVQVYRRALEHGIDNPEIRVRLAKSLYEARSYAEAARLFGEVAASQPAFRDVQTYLGSCLAMLGRFREAIVAHEKAIESAPGSALAHFAFGQTLLQACYPAAAVESFRHALRITPEDRRLRSCLLGALHYLPDVTQEQIYEASLPPGSQPAGDNKRAQHFPAITKDPSRKLRVAYVSADFRSHSVALFTYSVLAEHDPDQIEVTCLANMNAVDQDQVTEGFRRHAAHWHDIYGADDESVDALIRDHRIDILVDLAGHTAQNRLGIFERRAAPIQVTWIGYANTTGLAAMDYRLTDEIADPPGESDRWHTEELIRLPSGFLCFQPVEPSPPVAESPRAEHGKVTFGSFNAALKVNEAVIDAWSGIVNAVPDSRLVLKCPSFEHEEILERFRRHFEARGIGPERLDLLGPLESRETHLQAYSLIDIALDPFPYNGTTTTCEALWMGVPVICLHGNDHAGRVSSDILQRIGLAELVAGSEEEYVATARALAADGRRLTELRRGLRQRMRNSPLMDVDGFTRSLEAAYRQAWKRWCDSHDD